MMKAINCVGSTTINGISHIITEVRAVATEA
jgi:hypothetical protein